MPSRRLFAVSKIKLRAIILAALTGIASLLTFAGCTSTDFVNAAAKSMNRAFEYETTSDFFAPVLARALGEPAPRPMRPQAKQYYLTVIYDLEGLSVNGEKDLEQQGLLGEAFVLKTLAQWRLGRMADARTSSLRAKASKQEALSARNRALFVAFDGVVQLEGALDAVEAGKSYAEILPAIAGEGGAWRMFGAARTEAPRGDPLELDLIQARLASFVVLREARDREPPENLPKEDEAWNRLVAEARIELADLAAYPAADPAVHRQLVAKWTERCGLSAAAEG